MIAGLIGKIHCVNKRSILFNVNNVIYEIFANNKTICQVQSLSSHVFFYCTTVIYNEIPRLYGFLHKDDQNVFIALRNVRGIGASLASDITSHITISKLHEIITSESISDLLQIKGVGHKVAQRIINDLKNIGIPAPSSFSQGFTDDVISALSNLGYSKNDIESKALKYIYEYPSDDDSSLESILKYVLKKMRTE